MKPDPSLDPWELLTRLLERMSEKAEKNQRVLGTYYTRQKFSMVGELAFEHEPGCLLFGFCVLGVICSLLLFRGCASTWGESRDVAGLLLFGGTGVGVLLMTLFGLWWTDELTLNHHSRTYRRRRGVAFRAKTATGSFDDLSHLELREVEGGEGELFYEVLVVWKSGGVKPFSLFQTGGKPDSGREARELHEQLVTQLQIPGEVKATN